MNGAEEKIKGIERFKAFNQFGIKYRLYSPEAYGPRPLLLYLHGGGRTGDDNISQLREFGPVLFSEQYPEMYIMAPQCQDNPNRGEKKLFNSFENTTFFLDYGWSRKTLAAICDIIRVMIADGKVNPNKIYVTGMSLGGAGSIRMMSVGGDLFTAAVPVCPTMGPESYNILSGLTDAKIWVASAYLDQSLYRHKYITDAIMSLREKGNRNAHLTLFSPEELAKAGIPSDPEGDLIKKLRENHEVSQLVYRDVNGILSWLVSQTKNFIPAKEESK